MTKVRSRLIIYALVMCLSFGAVSAAYYKPVQVKASAALLLVGGALFLFSLAASGYFVTEGTYANIEDELESWWLEYAGANGMSYSAITKHAYISVEDWTELVNAAIEADEEAITAAIQDAVLAVIMYKLFGYEIPEALNLSTRDDEVFIYQCTAGSVWINATQLTAGMDLLLSDYKILVTVEDNNGVQWVFDYAFAALFIEMVRGFVNDCISKVGEYVAAMGTETVTYKSSVMNHKKSKVEDVYTQIYEDIINTLQFSLAQQDFGDASVAPGLYVKLAFSNFKDNVTAADLQAALESYGCEVTEQLTLGIGYYSKSNLAYLFLGFIPDDYDYLIMNGSGVGIYKEGEAEQKDFDICLFSSGSAGTYTFEIQDSDRISYPRYAAYSGLLTDGAYRYGNYSYGKMYLLGVPEDKVYTSLYNFSDGVTWDDELSGRVIYGTGAPTDIDVESPVISLDTYFEITKPLDDVGTDDEAAAQVVVDVVIPDYAAEIEEATGAITGAIDESSNKVVDAINNQTITQGNWFTQILDAIKAVPGAITGFFVIDTSKLTEHTQKISGLWEYKFGAIYEMSALFRDLSVEDDRTLPRLTIMLPEQYGDVEVAILDLSPWAEELAWVRGIIEAGLWLLFGTYCISLIKVNFNMT